VVLCCQLRLNHDKYVHIIPLSSELYRFQERLNQTKEEDQLIPKGDSTVPELEKTNLQKMDPKGTSKITDKV